MRQYVSFPSFTGSFIALHVLLFVDVVYTGTLFLDYSFQHSVEGATILLRCEVHINALKRSRPYLEQ